MVAGGGRFLSRFAGATDGPPPIWFMRQAGRYLPEYREVRASKGGFLELCYDPDAAAEVTLQPIRRFGLDAAIVFADILLIPQALGQHLTFEAGEGPRLDPKLSADGVARLDGRFVEERLGPIFETLGKVRRELDEDKALIGFAGAPWTVATYMLAGRGTKDPSAQRRFAYEEPAACAALMDVLVDATSRYLVAQARAGADALQIFDSWAAGLPTELFERLCVAPVAEIARRVKAEVDVPIIAFPRGAGPAYVELAALPQIDGVSVDTGLPPRWARETLSALGVVQGGLDPLVVVEGGEAMTRSAAALLNTYRGSSYVFNLGHGFVPETPPEHVAELVSFIREAR